MATITDVISFIRTLFLSLYFGLRGTPTVKPNPVQPRNIFLTQTRNAGNAFITDQILISLEILHHPSADAIESFLDILNGVCNAETQITFAEFTERGAR